MTEILRFLNDSYLLSLSFEYDYSEVREARSGNQIILSDLLDSALLSGIATFETLSGTRLPLSSREILEILEVGNVFFGSLYT